MAKTVFYSWQSDLEPEDGRDFIEKALRSSAGELAINETVTIEVAVDRDTLGVGGAPGIAETLLHKIEHSDVFVADVTIINSPKLRMWSDNSSRALKGRNRPLPNPNVLLELGYAVARLGWDRIILIQNVACGNPGALPFDLRARRVIPFQLPKSARRSRRSSESEKLEAVLRTALREILTPLHLLRRPRRSWFGFWRDRRFMGNSGVLFIYEAGPDGFLFLLKVQNGAHMGFIHGKAQYVGHESAVAELKGSDGKYCELSFLRHNTDHPFIEIIEGKDCYEHHGMRASFDGVYSLGPNRLLDYDAIDELDLQRLYKLTGNHYQRILDRFQDVHLGDDLETRCTVIRGGTPGLYTIREVILVKGSHGQLWVAYIDEDEDVVRYFTTEPNSKEQIPKSIEQWRSRFQEKQIVYMKEMSAIPTFENSSVSWE